MGQSSSKSGDTGTETKKDPNQFKGSPGEPPMTPGGAWQAPGAPPPYSSPGQEQQYQQPPGVSGPPPAYSATLNDSKATVGYSGYPGQSQYQQQYLQQQMGHFPQAPVNQAVHGQFDAGARFTAVSPVSLPPPPPGVAPTPAQVAAAQGRPVVMGQKESGILNGTGSGGVTFW